MPRSKPTPAPESPAEPLSGAQDALFDWDVPERLAKQAAPKGVQVRRTPLKERCVRCQEAVFPGMQYRAPAMVAYTITTAEGQTLRLCYEHAYQETGRA